jgi:hypothetical protein
MADLRYGAAGLGNLIPSGPLAGAIARSGLGIGVSLDIAGS